MAVEQILSAQDRQSAANHLFTFMQSCFGVGAMFVINGSMAEGRFGYNQGAPCPGVESVVFSLSLPSCFRVALSRGAIFHGPPSPDGEQVHGPLWAALGCPRPHEVVVAPVIVGDQTVILLYAQGSDGGRIDRSATSRMNRVCAALANTLVRVTT